MTDLTGCSEISLERSVSKGNLAGLKLDRETARFYETLITTLDERTDFEYRDPVIGLFDIPVMVYAVGWLSPGKGSNAILFEKCPL